MARLAHLQRYTAAALALAALAVPPARAQTLEAGLTGGTAHGRASVSLSGVEAHGARLRLGLAYDGAVQLDVGAQVSEVFGPLGNLVGQGDLAIRTDRRAQADLGASGVLGPLALGVRLVAFTSDPAVFDPLAIASAKRPDFGAPGVGAQLDVTGRPGSALIVHASPALYVVGGHAAERLDARLRWLRAIGSNELSLRLRGYLAPGARAGDVAAGVGFTYRRRAAPSLDGAVYVGSSGHGVRPGATASVGQDLGPVEASLTASAEPYRTDVPPFRLDLALAFGLGAGQAHVDVAGASGPGGSHAVLALRYDLPVTLPGPAAAAQGASGTSSPLVRSSRNTP